MAQLMDDDQPTAPPPQDDVDTSMEELRLSRQMRTRGEDDDSAPLQDDALVSEDTLKALKDAGNLVARASRWTWEKAKQGAAVAAEKTLQAKAAAEESLAQRKAQRAIDAEANRVAMEALAARRLLEQPQEEPAIEVAPVEAVPAPEALKPMTPRVVHTDPSTQARRLIRNAFIAGTLLLLAFAGAWWALHGNTPEPAVPKTALTPLETDPVVAAPAEVIEPVAQAPVVPVPVIAPEPVAVVEAAPASIPEAKPAPVVARPSPKPAAVRPRPVAAPAPARTEDWQNEAKDEMDAWAEQMGIEDR
jgi:hypothetical protein